MTRRDWWLGVAAVGIAILFHAAFPRYDWRGGGSAPLVRIDRWTSQVDHMRLYQGRYYTVTQLTPPKDPQFDFSGIAPAK